MISLHLSTTPRRIGNLTGGRSAASAPWDFAPSAVLAEPSLDGSIIIPFPGSWPPPDAVRHLYRHFSQSFSKFLLTLACRSKAPREHYVPVGMYMQFSKSVKGLFTDSPYQPLHLFGIKRRLVNLFSGNFLKFRPQIYFLPHLPFYLYHSVTPILLRRRLSARFRETLHATLEIFSASAISLFVIFLK